MQELTQDQATKYIAESAANGTLRDNFPLYAYLNIWIKTKQAELVRFRLNKLQKKLWLIVKEKMDNNLPIRLYFIKSRQTGSTTFWLALIYWLTTLWKNRNALIVAHDDESASALGDKFQNYYQRSHSLLKPEVRKMNRAEIYFANTLSEYEKTGEVGHDCHIDNMTANKPNLGRSYTYQWTLLSEFGVWEENGINCKEVLSALFQTVPRIAGTGIIIETTMKVDSNGGGFARDFWDDKENGFEKIFISWIADDTYRVNLPIGEYFELGDSEDLRYGNEFKIKDIIEKELIYWDVDRQFKDNPVALHHECMCRLAWRRETIDTGCLGDLGKFKQEYPLTIADAFAASAAYVFPITQIEMQEQRIKDDNIVSSNFNFNATDEAIEPYKHGKVKIYEQPDTRGLYVIGGDGAQGINGGDSSSLVVMRVPEMYEVCSYADIISPSDFAALANFLSRYYNNALLGIEVNDKGGFAAIETIRATYPRCNLYYRRTLATPKINQEVKYGWITNEVTRSVMIEELRALLYYGQIEFYNPEILAQLHTFVKHKNGKCAAAHGKKDDLVLAAMIATQLAKYVQVQKEQVKPKFAPKGSAEWMYKRMEQRRGQHLGFNIK